MVFGPIWTKWLSIKSCWACFKNCLGPSKKSKVVCPSAQQFFLRLFGPIRFLMLPVRFFWRSVFWPIWTKRVFIKSCELSTEKFFRPNWNLETSTCLQQATHVKTTQPYVQGLMIHILGVITTRLKCPLVLSKSWFKSSLRDSLVESLKLQEIQEIP